MQLLDMPNELLLSVAENLPIRDIYRFLSTCSRLSSVLTPLLGKLGEQDVGKQSALNWAVDRGHAPLAKLAILGKAKKVMPDDEDGQSRSPLHLAVLGYGTKVVRLLAAHGDATDARDKDFQMPIHLAAKRRDSKLCENLIEHNACKGGATADV